MPGAGRYIGKCIPDHRSATMNTEQTHSELEQTTLPQDDKLAGEIYFRTGIKPELWVSAFIPVLALIEEMSTLHYTRKHLAAKLALDENMPLGLQLWKKGKLTAGQANYLDAKLYEGKKIKLKFAFEGKGDDIPEMFLRLRRAGMISGPVLYCGGGSQFFAELQTEKFLPLIKAVTQAQENAATLLLINGSPIVC